MERSKWTCVSLLLIAACSAAPHGTSVIPGGPAAPRETGAQAAEAPHEPDPARVVEPAVHPAPPVTYPASATQGPPDAPHAAVAKDAPEILEALAMFERVCERDLVAGVWTDEADANHRALFGMCQALAVAYDEEARRQRENNHLTEAARRWERAAKIDLWFDPPARLARLELARLDKEPSRETFCNAIGALSPPLWCSAGLPLEALAAANGCERLDHRCPPVDGSLKSPRFDLGSQLERDPIDHAALDIAGSAACKPEVKERDALLRALAAGVRGWKTCKARGSTGS